MAHRLLQSTKSCDLCAMMRKTDFAAVVLILISIICFFWKLAFTNLILVGLDLFTYFYPYWHHTAQAIRAGRIPLWNPYLFMGVPFLANIQTAFFYGINWPFLMWLDTPRALAASIMFHVFIGGVLMYLLTRRTVGLSPQGSFTAALIFSLGGFAGAQVEHINQLNVIAWLPLLVMLAHRAIKSPPQIKGLWGRQAPLAAVVAVMVFAGHIQALYICLATAGVYVLISGWSKGGFKRAGSSLLTLALAITLGLILASVQLLPTLELARHSIRSQGLPYEDAVAFSLRPHLAAYSFLPPYAVKLDVIFGSRAFTEYVAYVGIIGLLLALAGVFAQTEEKFPWLGLAALGLFLALGKVNPLYRLLYEVVPGFASFRAPARWLLLYAFGVAVLAGVGLDAVSSHRLSFRAAWAWLIPCGLIGLLPSFYFARPGLVTLLAWMGFGVLASLAIRAVWRKTISPWVLALLLLVELFLASRGLPYNHPTAPQAFTSWRTAPLYMRAAGGEGQWTGRPLTHHPSRFLSFSPLTFDPGDLGEIRSAFLDTLGEKGVYDYVVASKQKEIMAPNLPLLYGFHSVDGYDGGLLPLREYVNITARLYPGQEISLDGRLYQLIHRMPSDDLLDLFNIRFVITDKVYDLWVDGVYYDLSLGASLEAGETITITVDEGFIATGIGFISYLVGDVADGTPVAEVELIGRDGWRSHYIIRAGADTSARIVGHTPDFVKPRRDYGHTTRRWPGWHPIGQVILRGLLRQGSWHLQGASLFNELVAAHRPLIISDQGPFRLVHSGDVKVYENLDVLPRAFIVHDGEALKKFPPVLEEILNSEPGENAAIEVYEPERVVVQANLQSPGYLVLTDAFYPGWEARSRRKGPLPIIKAWGFFRAVWLPAGNDVVEFTYHPALFRLGMVVSLAAGMLLVLACRLGTR